VIEYQKFIRSAFKKKYSQSTYINQKLLNSFFDSRNKFLVKSFEKFKISLDKSKKEKDNVLSNLKNIYKKKQNLNNLDHKKVYDYYKKFNIFLRLLKKNKKSTNPLSYLYLGFLILKIKKINEIQKLNFILKVNDRLSIEKNIIFTLEEIGLLLNLYKFESLCLKKISK
tara:strand:- start:191 stop:697 length:507 start_codon:yes stop_codon:yes gene_type:complete